MKKKIWIIVIVCLICVAVALLGNRFWKTKMNPVSAESNTVVEPTPDFSLLLPTPTPEPQMAEETAETAETSAATESAEEAETADPEPAEPASVPGETALPVITPAPVENGVDLWLDASDTVSENQSISKTSKNGSPYYEKLPGIWYGNFFYGWNESKNDKTSGWLPRFLNDIISYSNENVRLLRLAKESINRAGTTAEDLLWDREGESISFPEVLNKYPTAIGKEDAYRVDSKKRFNFLELGQLKNTIHPFPFFAQEDPSKSCDVLLYALQHLNNRKISMIVVDTIGMEDIDAAEYQKAIQQQVRDSAGDFAVAYFGLQLDYAGRISTIYGTHFSQALYWGFARVDGRKGLQRMPRALLVIVTGPKDALNEYTEGLTTYLNSPDIRGNYETATALYPEKKVLRYQDQDLVMPDFSFEFVQAKMEAVDIDDLVGVVVSGDLTGSDSKYYIDGQVQETRLFEYREDETADPQAIPIVTLNAPYSVDIRLPLPENNDTEVDYSSLGFDMEFSLEKAFRLDRMDLNQMVETTTNENINDLVYTCTDGLLYCYHPMEGKELQDQLKLQASEGTLLEDGTVSFTLSSSKVPHEGYYLVHCIMKANTGKEKLSAINALPAWMLSSGDVETGWTRITGTGVEGNAAVPSVIPSQGATWDYTPSANNSNWHAFKNAMSACDDMAREDLARQMVVTDIPKTPDRNSLSVHHVLGVGGDKSNNIPPVYRIFHLNAIGKAIREGLFYQSRNADFTFAEFDVILHVPSRQEP